MYQRIAHIALVDDCDAAIEFYTKKLEFMLLEDTKLSEDKRWVMVAPNRNSSFEPVILPKRQVVITEELEDKVIGLYALGVSTRDITKHIKELYQMDISAATLSAITDKVIPAMNEWRTGPLASVYAFVYLDCMHYKVREGGSVVTRAVYNILAINLQGQKDLIGMCLKVKVPNSGSPS